MAISSGKNGQCYKANEIKPNVQYKLINNNKNYKKTSPDCSSTVYPAEKVCTYCAYFDTTY